MRLELRDIHFRRDATEILRGVDLQLKAGEVAMLPAGQSAVLTANSDSVLFRSFVP